MSSFWEKKFAKWSLGPSATEKERIERTEKQIKKAISNSTKLNNRNIKIFTQGSYRNRVNVAKDSDIDIGVLCYDTYFPEYPDDNVKILLEKTSADATYTYSVFKNEIEEALINMFGSSSVKRGNMAFDIKSTGYRVEADVAAFFEHRRYTSTTNYLSGVEMIPDNFKPRRVRNWPEQHYNNGVYKNTQTQRKYKRIIRILKALSNEMKENGSEIANLTPSFLIECLVWNTPNDSFKYSSFYSTLRAVLAYLFNNTIHESDSKEWGEVSELKYLFRISQPWTLKQAHKFLSDAWDYVGYE